MNNENLVEIGIDVHREIAKQDAKWGDKRKLDSTLWMTIFMEEVGEVAKEVLEKNNALARAELVQCAALCFQMIAAIDSGGFKR